MKVWTYTVLDRGYEIEGGDDYETQDEAQAAADERASGWTARERERFAVRVESFEVEVETTDRRYRIELLRGGQWTDDLGQSEIFDDLGDACAAIESVQRLRDESWRVDGRVIDDIGNIVDVPCPTGEFVCETMTGGGETARIYRASDGSLTAHFERGGAMEVGEDWIDDAGDLI